MTKEEVSSVENKLQQLSLEQKAALLTGISQWETQGYEHARIPSFVMSDGPHGVRRQADTDDHINLDESKTSTCFPTAVTAACSWDPHLISRMAEAIGEEARLLGVDVMLGPGINIKRNPLCGRNFEYFSEDPLLSGRLAVGYVEGMQRQGVSACPKHLTANNQELRRQASNSLVDERTLRELYLTAFEIVVREAHVRIIMSSYNQINGSYAHENSHILDDILRKEWGYDGVIVSDWGASNNAVQAVAAGGTLEMPSAGLTSARELVRAVKNGLLDEKFIDARAREMIALADKSLSSVRKDKIDSLQLSTHIIDEHNILARQVALNSFVLLKNNNNILPLTKRTRLAVVGDFAREMRFQGSGSSRVHSTRAENLLKELSILSLIHI